MHARSTPTVTTQAPAPVPAAVPSTFVCAPVQVARAETVAMNSPIQVSALAPETMVR